MHDRNSIQEQLDEWDWTMQSLGNIYTEVKKPEVVNKNFN